MLGLRLSLDIDFDALADMVDDSLPWVEAWLAILSLVLAATVVIAASNWMRARRSPVARLVRRRR